MDNQQIWKIERLSAEGRVYNIKYYESRDDFDAAVKDGRTKVIAKDESIRVSILDVTEFYYLDRYDGHDELPLVFSKETV